MQVLNLMQCTELGGMERASLRLMQALIARGHRVSVLSLNPLGRLAPHLASTGIEAVGLPYRGRGGWRGLPAIRRALHRSRHDALMMTGHHLLAMTVLPACSRGHRMLAIHHVHDGVKPAWQWRLIYRLACRRFQWITFASDALRREALSFAPGLAQQSLTMRNPLPLPAQTTLRSRTEARRVLGLPEQAQVVGNAGRLIAAKRFDVFIQTAAKIARLLPRTRFVIAGDGPERGRLHALAAEAGIADRLLWLGWRSELDVFYRALDLLLYNADYEALPTTPMEAMAFGLPVVASLRSGGLDEIIQDEGHGVLLARHDPAALARIVVDVLADSRPTGCAARARIAALARPEYIAADVEALLAQTA